MIYILYGEDIKNKTLYTKELAQNREIFFITPKNENKEVIMSYLGESLFGCQNIVVLEDVLKEGKISFSVKELTLLKESDTVFVFKEDKLSVLDQKKYKNYSEIKNFELKKTPTDQKFNIFKITDAFERRDKMTTWKLYNQSISFGIEPEAIAGALFWKIKTMILTGTRFFNKQELMLFSSRIVSLYHRSHKGESDFVIGVEQFILASLSSR